MASTFVTPSALSIWASSFILAWFEAGRKLQLREQGGDDVQVLGTVHLRDHDGVESRAGLFDHLDQVPVEVRGVERVGAVERRPPAPVEFLQGLDDVLAGRRLVVGSDGVFEVEEDGVGF